MAQQPPHSHHLLRSKSKSNNNTNNNTNSKISNDSVASSPESSSSTTITNTVTDQLKTVIQTLLVEELNQLKKYFQEVSEQNKNEIIKQLTLENEQLKSDIVDLKHKDQEKSKLVNQLEKDVVDLQQYIRRNNIEIWGIPENIQQNKLESTVIKIANAIGVEIYDDDIEACHRLKGKNNNNNNPKKTIVRFTNRKICDQLHKQKGKLKEGNVKKELKNLNITNNVFINSNLCPYFRFLWGKCKKLLDEKLLNRFWIYNGYIFITHELDSEKIKITHLSDLKREFPGYDFEYKH